MGSKGADSGLEIAPNASVEGVGLRAHVGEVEAVIHGLGGPFGVGGGDEVAAVVAGAFVVGEGGAAGGDEWVFAEVVVAGGGGAEDFVGGEDVGDPVGLLVLLVVGECVAGVTDDDVRVGCGGDGEAFGCGIGDGATLKRVLNGCEDEYRDNNGKYNCNP